LKTGDFALARDDEIVQATLVCEGGQVVQQGSAIGNQGSAAKG
jgi:hypothetical protein